MLPLALGLGFAVGLGRVGAARLPAAGATSRAAGESGVSHIIPVFSFQDDDTLREIATLKPVRLTRASGTVVRW